MNTNNFKHTYGQVEKTIVKQTCGKKKHFRRTILVLLRSARRSPNIAFAIFSLSIIFPYLRSEERRGDAYRILAEKLSSCSKEEHLDLVEYVLLNSYDRVLNAMCWVLQYEWGTGDHEEENIEMQRDILRSKKIAHYFDFQYKV